MKEVMGEENRLHVIKATRLAVIKQITKTEDELLQLYKKLSIPEYLVKGDVKKNNLIIQECVNLGAKLTS